jgi:hypothetical protein
MVLITLLIPHPIAPTSRPQSAASVQACISSFSSLSGFVVLNAGPVVIARTSIRWAFSGYSLLIVAVCVPLIFLLCSWLGVEKVEVMDKPPDLSAPTAFSDHDELATMSETTPLKRAANPTRL